MKKSNQFISGHGVWYKCMCEYNQKLPMFLLTRDEDLRLDILRLRLRMLECMKGFKAALNDKKVLEELEYEK